jgi:hypothetical protein
MAFITNDQHEQVVLIVGGVSIDSQYARYLAQRTQQWPM